MRILIVEDELELGPLLVKMLAAVDHMTLRRVDHFYVVTDLEAAVKMVGEVDAVLCDGSFPVSSDTTSPSENWSIVAYRAQQSGVPCVVYSGDPDSVALARECGNVAFGKPAPIEALYKALVAPRPAADSWQLALDGAAQESAVRENTGR